MPRIRFSARWMLYPLLAGPLWTQQVCPEGRAASGHIGITQFACRAGPCAVSVRDSTGFYHDFAIEPSVVMAKPLATAGLRDGDIIVTVDGLPVTTRAAGRRLANMNPGERISLGVRRTGARLLVVEIARPGCNTPDLTVRSP